MTNKKPLLSICIPTYNREIYLKRLLESIICQKEFIETDDIEIVIDDWPSKDNTENLVKEYQKKHKNIRYFRNTKAIGMCPAFLEAISLSNWEYTWLLGSDEVMWKDALENIVDQIKKQKPSLILSDTEDIDDIKKYDTIKFSDKKLKQFYGFSDFSIFLWENYKNTHIKKQYYFTFISIFCFRTDLFTTSLSNLLKEYGWEKYNDIIKKNYFNFWMISYFSLTSSEKIILLEYPLLFAQMGNHWWKPNMKIIKDLYIFVNQLKEHYPISNSCKRFFKKMLKTWFIICVSWVIKNNYFLKHIHKPLAYIWKKLFVCFE